MSAVSISKGVCGLAQAIGAHFVCGSRVLFITHAVPLMLHSIRFRLVDHVSYMLADYRSSVAIFIDVVVTIIICVIAFVQPLLQYDLVY